MELKIYNQSDVLKLTLNSDSSSTHMQELNGADNLAITATAFSCVKLDVNDYVIIDEVRYSIKSPYLPQKKSNSEYEYRVNLYAPIHDAEQAMFFNLTDGQYNSEFSLDGSPTEHLQKWVDNMNRLYDTDKWSIGTVIVAANKTIDYNNIYCWDAAFGDSGIAKTFETEMWADGYTINLCKCERGEMVELGYLNGLTSLTQDDNDSSVKFFTRLIPLGSTKNIDPASYGYSRLQLPSRAKWVDRNTDYGIYEYNEEKAFAGIFPHYIGTVTSVRSEEKTGENGIYTVYYFSDSVLPFNPNEYEIAETIKKLSFTSGDLNGREFEANWHADTSEWEIINIYPDNDTQIPGGNLIPRVGDSYFPWNIKMPQSYITAAENDYKAAVDDLLAKYSDSKNKYIASTDYIDITKRGISLRIGQMVKLISSEYFTDGYINIRIVKVVRKLDELNDATITLSHQAEGNWASSVDNSINDLKYIIANKTEQLSNDIIKKYEDLSDTSTISSDIKVNTQQVGYYKIGDVILSGTTIEKVIKNMLYKASGAELKGTISTSNDVEFGSAKGVITYQAVKNGNGDITKAYYDNNEANILTFGAEMNGIRTATRQLQGNYTQNETYSAKVTFAQGTDCAEVTLENRISVNVRRKWFAGVVSSIPTTSAEVRALLSSGLYTGAGTYKFSAGIWKMIVICIPTGTIQEISVTAYPGNFIEDGGVCSGPTVVSVEGANGSEAQNYNMWIIKAETNNDADTLTFKTT